MFHIDPRVGYKAHVPPQWRHNEHDSVSNHQPHDCLPNRLFRRRSMKTSKLRVTGLCVGNSPGTGEFPTQMASNAESVSIWWRHHAIGEYNSGPFHRMAWLVADITKRKPSNPIYKSHQIPTHKCFSSCLAIVFAPTIKSVIMSAVQSKIIAASSRYIHQIWKGAIVT